MTAQSAACDGKHPFTCKALAMKAAARAPKRKAYKCTHCGAYHVGRDILKPKKYA